MSIIAETIKEAVDASKVPTSASTKFFIPLWTSADGIGDGTFMAHHMLLHAIGFSTKYDKFRQHVDGNRNFRQADDASGTILAKLTRVPYGEHIDPDAGTVNGFDQSASVMRPDRVTGLGLLMGGQEKSVLNAAIDWSSKNINITVKYVGLWNPKQRSYIDNAVNSAKMLFGSNGSGHGFTWTVELAFSKVGDRS